MPAYINAFKYQALPAFFELPPFLSFMNSLDAVVASMIALASSNFCSRKAFSALDKLGLMGFWALNTWGANKMTRIAIFFIEKRFFDLKISLVQVSYHP